MHIIHVEDSLACVQCFIDEPTPGTGHGCWYKGWAGYPFGRSAGPWMTRADRYAISGCDPERLPENRLALLFTCQQA
jgi:hypothetical protein